MFGKSADLYDTIYLNIGKDYAAESRKVNEYVQQHKLSTGNALLDVACGTGIHVGYLREFFQIEGLDVDEGMLRVACKKHPDLVFRHGDMVNFSLNHQFDVITCLFSSVGYLVTVQRLYLAIQNMARHLKPGGVLLIEPWFTPEQWNPGHIHALFIDQPNLKIVRMNVSNVKSRITFLDFHYLVGTPNGIRHFTERHELGLFTHTEYLEAFQAANLDVIHDPEGLDGRGLYIGKKALDV
jgi:ubiquinone/menaquinone biosynthesis C-methylase UbiE